MIINTTYKALKNSPVATVHWLVTADLYFSPYDASSAGRFIDDIPRKLKDFVESTNNWTHPKIKFIPVVSADLPERMDRTFYRGYKMDGTKVLPLVIRGKELGEIDITVSRGWQQDWNAYASGGYSDPLTDGEKKQLRAWFGEQLIAATTTSLINDLKARAISAAFKASRIHLDAETKRYQTALADCLAFQTEYSK